MSRPRGFAHASSLAGNLIDREGIRQIEDGPYGGTPLMIGEEQLGGIITTSHHYDGSPWGSVRLYDFALAQTAFALSQSNLWLPGSAKSVELNIVSLDKVAKLGLYHLDISGPPPRAPFAKSAYSPTATYPCLWNHNAQNETRMVCNPDSQLQVRQGLEAKLPLHGPPPVELT